MERRVYIYVFDHDTRRLLKYRYLQGDDISISNITRTAEYLAVSCRECQTDIYAVDNRPGLGRDCRTALMSELFTDWVQFADICWREGIKIDTWHHKLTNIQKQVESLKHSPTTAIIEKELKNNEICKC